MMSTLTFSFLRRFASFTSCKETRQHQLLTAHSSLTDTSAHEEPGNSSRDVLPETQSPGSASQSQTLPAESHSASKGLCHAPSVQGHRALLSAQGREQKGNLI